MGDGVDDRGRLDLVVVAGLAGVGKSTLARALAGRLKFAYYDKDTMTSPLTDAFMVALGSPLGRDDRESELYSTQVRPLEYECLRNAAMESLRIGVSAIITAPFLREVNDASWRKALAQDCLTAGSRPAHCHCVWMHCDSETMRRRLIRRGSARDAAKLAHWDAYVSRCAAIRRPIMPCLEVDASGDDALERNVEKIVERFGLA